VAGFTFVETLQAPDRRAGSRPGKIAWRRNGAGALGDKQARLKRPSAEWSKATGVGTLKCWNPRGFVFIDSLLPTCPDHRGGELKGNKYRYTDKD
jgi:hypothetical protein